MAKTAEKKSKPEKNIYIYENVDSRGTKILGEIEAESLILAKAHLRKNGVNAKKIKRKSTSTFSLSTKEKICSQDITIFARQMATMLNAGVPLVQSLNIVSKGTDKKSVQELVNSIKNDIEAGQSFSESLKKYPKYFEPLFCSLVAAGETSGSLEIMLTRISTYREKSETLRRKIKKALYYPTAVIIVAIIVTVILLLFVVPQFQTLFKSFGAELPAFTQLVISLSNGLQKFWWLFFLILAMSCWIFSTYKKKSPQFRLFLDKISLKLPIVGPILKKAAIARFARTLSTTFSAGVPIDQGLDSVVGATGNLIYSEAITKIKENVTTGVQLQMAMRSALIFPNMIIQMVAIGEESGTLDSMLDKVASIYEEEVDLSVDALSSLLEPLIMSILGVLVGGLVIAMYLPIFKMGSIM
jgi:type IV pilus assembly protein PilC